MDFELVLALNLGYLLGVKRCLNFTTKQSSRLTKIKQLSLDCYNSFSWSYTAFIFLLLVSDLLE